MKDNETIKLKRVIWRNRRKQDGWTAIHIFGPAELTAQVKQLKRQFKLANSHLYARL